MARLDTERTDTARTDVARADVAIGETRGMQVRRIVDLSVPIGPDTQVYPGDPHPG